MRIPIEKSATTPTSANVVACRGQVTRPRHELVNGHRVKALRFTGLARVGYFQDNDARALMPWLRKEGDGTGLCHSRCSFFNLQLSVLPKNQVVTSVSHYTLRRIEGLRRSILKERERIDGQGGEGNADGIMEGAAMMAARIGRGNKGAEVVGGCTFLMRPHSRRRVMRML